MRYRIVLTPAARRGLRALPKEAFDRVDVRLQSLADSPRPRDSRRLLGKEGFHRIRVGDYRIIYQIEKDHLVIVVVRIGHRREVYRRL